LGALVVNVPIHYRPIQQEHHMYIKTADLNALSVFAVAIAACTLYAGDVAAGGREVAVTLQVSTHGLDLDQPAGARELYSRLKDAAWILCTRANRVGLTPSPDANACSEKALGEAIRSAHIPLLVQAYLETHSPAQAAAHGIDVPIQLAAK
jgi:UrcA family protein